MRSHRSKSVLNNEFRENKQDVKTNFTSYYKILSTALHLTNRLISFDLFVEVMDEAILHRLIL